MEYDLKKVFKLAHNLSEEEIQELLDKDGPHYDLINEICSDPTFGWDCYYNDFFGFFEDSIVNKLKEYLSDEFLNHVKNDEFDIEEDGPEEVEFYAALIQYYYNDIGTLTNMEWAALLRNYFNNNMLNKIEEKIK